MRLKVLQSYLDAKSPISAYGLPAILGLSTRSGMMGIYRALDFLEEVGAIHRIQLLGSFVVCRQWGRDPRSSGHLLRAPGDTGHEPDFVLG